MSLSRLTAPVRGRAWEGAGGKSEPGPHTLGTLLSLQESQNSNSLGKRFQGSKIAKAHNSKIPMEEFRVFNILSPYDSMLLILETSSPILHHWPPNLKTLAQRKSRNENERDSEGES